MSHKFDPAHLAKLDAPERRNLLAPLQTLSKLGYQPENTFADLGCGTGLFTLQAAAISQEKASIYAIDIAQQMLDEIEKRAMAAHFSNVQTVLADEYNFKIPNESADFLIVCTVLHEVDDKVRWLKEAARICRKGGSISIIEFNPAFTGSGPPMKHRLPKEETVSDLKAAGFSCTLETSIQDAFYIVKATKP